MTRILTVGLCHRDRCAGGVGANLCHSGTRGRRRGRRTRPSLLRQCAPLCPLAPVRPRSFRGLQKQPSPRFRATRSTRQAASCPTAPYGFATPGLGRIISTQRTDKSGLFEFRAVDPGSYIVELLGAADTVLAASQLINVNAGETVSTVVKLPFRLPPLGGLFGHTTAQAIAITSAAAATGVLNAATTTDVSADGTN